MISSWVLLILMLIALCLYFNHRTSLTEPFNSQRSIQALNANPNECPFEYLELEQLPSVGTSSTRYQVRSKLKGQPQPEPDSVFDSLEEYRNRWNQMIRDYPNLAKCGDPYTKYLNKQSQQPFQMVIATTQSQTNHTNDLLNVHNSLMSKTQQQLDELEQLIQKNQSTLMGQRSAINNVQQNQNRERSIIGGVIQQNQSIQRSTIDNVPQQDQSIQRSTIDNVPQQDQSIQRSTIDGVPQRNQIGHRSIIDNVPQQDQSIDNNPQQNQSRQEQIQSSVPFGAQILSREQQNQKDMISTIHNATQRLESQINNLNQRLSSQVRAIVNQNAIIGDKRNQINVLNDKLRGNLAQLEIINRYLKDINFQSNLFSNSLEEHIGNLREQFSIGNNPYLASSSPLSSPSSSPLSLSLTPSLSAPVPLPSPSVPLQLPLPQSLVPFTDPSGWSIIQQRASDTNCPTCPNFLSDKMGNYATVFNETAYGSFLPKFRYEAMIGGRYYRPEQSDVNRESLIRKVSI